MNYTELNKELREIASLVTLDNNSMDMTPNVNKEWHKRLVALAPNFTDRIVEVSEDGLRITRIGAYGIIVEVE